MENHNFDGQIHYKWAIFNSYVSLPEGNPSFWFNQLVHWINHEPYWLNPTLSHCVTSMISLDPFFWQQIPAKSLFELVQSHSIHLYPYYIHIIFIVSCHVCFPVLMDNPVKSVFRCVKAPLNSIKSPCLTLDVFWMVKSIKLDQLRHIQ